MPEFQQLYSFDESTGYWLRQVYLSISEALQSRLNAFDVTVAQWPVLSSLYSGNSRTPAELAEHIGVNRGAITRLLDRLEKKELVERESSAYDGRSFQVRLTERGRSIVPQLSALSRKLTGSFSPVYRAHRSRSLRGRYAGCSTIPTRLFEGQKVGSHRS